MPTKQAPNSRLSTDAGIRLRGQRGGALKLAAAANTIVDGSVPAPVNLVAITGEPVNYWGDLIIFDLASMVKPGKVPLDYCHEYQETIGFLDSFELSTGALAAAGMIVPFEKDRGAELIVKMAAGVPYQASIECDEYELEYVDEGQSVPVNGKDRPGPIWVLRDWELKGVAICKYGQDDETSATLALSEKNSRHRQVKLSGGPKSVPATGNTADESVPGGNLTNAATSTVTPAAAGSSAATGTTTVSGSSAGDTGAPTGTPAAAAPAATVPAADPVALAQGERATFKAFVTEFGNERAAVYFSEGLSLENARGKEIIRLRAENADLRKPKADRGAPGPVALNQGAEGQGTVSSPFKVRR